jgi:hypothetical protein
MFDPAERPRTTIAVVCLFLLALMGMLAFVTAMVTHAHAADSEVAPPAQHFVIVLKVYPDADHASQPMKQLVYKANALFFDSAAGCKDFMDKDAQFKADLMSLVTMLSPIVKEHPDASMTLGCEVDMTGQSS